MDGARIALFEDNESIRSNLIKLMELEGHVLVAEAGTPDEADAVICNLAEESVDVAIVDGNLSPRLNGEDGAKITKLLHQKFESIIVIGYSGMDDVDGADVQVGKGRGHKLLEVIRDL